MSLMRTFVAIPMPTSITKKALKIISAMNEAGAKLRWSSEQQLHITLCFLGDIEDQRVVDACRAVERVANRQEMFTATISGLGTFPDAQRARVLWLGVTDGESQISDLQKQTRESLEDEAFSIDRGRYHPHITLGRAPRGRVDHRLPALIEAQAVGELGQISVSELVLYHSHLTRSGPIYTPLGRFDLA